MTAGSAPALAPAALPRRLGSVAAAGTLIGIMVGSGIFRVPATVATHVPSPVGFMLVWLVGGMLSLAGALMMAELAAMFPSAGGRYVYLREGIHPVAAFAYGIGNILLLRPVSLAARALLVAAYLGTVLPAFAGHEVVVAAVLIVALSLINYRSAVAGAGVTTATSVAKVLALLLVVGLILVNAPSLPPTAAPTAPFSASGFGLALVTVMWTYSGWGSTTYITGDVRNAERTMPRVLALGVLGVVGLFLLVNFALLRALPMPELAASHTVAADAVTRVLGPGAGWLLSLLVVIAVLGSLTGSLLADARLPFAIGQDAERLRWLGRVHRAYGTPHVAVALTGALALFALRRGSFEQLVSDYILGSWPFYVLVAVGYFRLRRRRPDLARPYRTPGYPFVPAFFLVASTVMIVNAVVADPLKAATGSWVMLVGIPVYFLVRVRAPRAIR